MTKKSAGRDQRDDDAATPDDPIMRQLKTIYDEVAEKPLPADLAALLEKLDRAERDR